MYSTILSKILTYVGGHFDSLILDFLGIIPKIKDKKRISIDTSENNLIKIFLENLGTESPNKEEEALLKNRLIVSNSYLESLKNKTQARLMNDLNSYFFGLKNKKQEIDPDQVKKIVKEEIEKNTNYFKMVVESESHATANMASAMQIAKVGESRGESDPYVYFSVVRDERNDTETLRLHLLPDKITPRVWRLSELNTGYHVRGGNTPSVLGTNPFCRCRLVYIPKSYGFNSKGQLVWKSLDWDEFKYQRENYEIPQTIEIKKKKKEKAID